MGNSLLKNFNIDKDPYLTGGFKNLWKIYNGSRKDRKQDVSIFVLDKKILDKYSKDEKEEILNILKKEANSLIKYKHPGILGIVEPLLEDKNTLVFVTEPIQYSLSSWVEGGNVSKLETKLIISELCGVLSFLHEDAKVIHSNLTLDNVFITSAGHIKISGMGYSILDSPITGTEFKINNNISNAMPDLKHIAPEIVINNIAYYSSDIFSLGSIIYNMLKIIKNDSEKELISINNNTTDSYKRQFDTIDSKLSRLNFESDDNELLYKALNKKYEYRPSVKDIMEYTWFNDPKLKALRFIENIETNDSAKNTEFLSKFPNILNVFDNKIIERRFLPVFMNSIKIESLIVPVLPAIFAICESQHKVDFENLVWPGLKILFGMKQIPAAALYFILSKLNFLAEKISNTEFSSNMLNIICKALDCGVAKIQAVVMENLLFIIKKIDSLAFKNQIFPRLVNIVLNTSSNSLKVAILKSWTSIYSLLDQNIINESLLNTLEKIRKNDNNSEICMCLVNIYEEIAKVVSVESIANKILPNLISILVNGNISKGSFEIIMKLVQKYLTRIKEFREKDLAIEEKTEIKDVTIISNTNSSKADKDDFNFLNSFFGSSVTPVLTNNISNSNNTSSNVNNFNMSNNTFPKKDFNFEFLEAKKENNIFEGLQKEKKTNQKTINNDIFDQFNFDTNPKPIDNQKNKPSLDTLLNDIQSGYNNKSNYPNNTGYSNNLINQQNNGNNMVFNMNNNNIDDEFNLDFLKDNKKKTSVNQANSNNINFDNFDFIDNKQDKNKNANILDGLLKF